MLLSCTYDGGDDELQGHSTVRLGDPCSSKRSRYRSYFPYPRVFNQHDLILFELPSRPEVKAT